MHVYVSVIGDEILKGQVADTNTHFITRHLFSWGVKVKRVHNVFLFLNMFIPSK